MSDIDFTQPELGSLRCASGAQLVTVHRYQDREAGL
jgi:hypothetical protein